jgi:hypothetical protein
MKSLSSLLVAAVAIVGSVTAEVPSTDETAGGGYTWDDNKSWAVSAASLADPPMQVFYDSFMEDCRQDCRRMNYDPIHYCDVGGT